MNLTGTIEQSLSHHSSVFAISKLSHSYAKKEAVALNYDFSESKTELFVKRLENLSDESENSLGDDLDDFLNIFNTKIDEFFKLDQPKISKRNWLVNPWITEGLIISINKKESLYEDWKRTTSINDKTGDLHLYQKYRSYRITLKHAITAAKTSSYHKRINNSVRPEIRFRFRFRSIRSIFSDPVPTKYRPDRPDLTSKFGCRI